MTNKKSMFVTAAIVGILGAATATAVKAAEATHEVKGHCVGANSCKGQSACKMVGKNDCGGKNGCGGKGFIEKTKAECDALAIKNKKIKFEANKG